MPPRRDSKIHSPLADGQIRLLRLKPANDHSAPIDCSLFAISPTKSTQYEAVSYTWGDPKRDRVIKVNSLDFQISRNLFELLPYLRRSRSDRVLWIDALCINQENPKERPSQVKMMGEIYKGASHVVIFLGKKWDGLTIATEYLKLAARQEDAHLNPALEPHLHVRSHLDIASILLTRIRSTVRAFPHLTLSATLPSSSRRSGSSEYGQYRNSFLQKGSHFSLRRPR